jgi:hypothetical protein
MFLDTMPMAALPSQMPPLQVARATAWACSRFPPDAPVMLCDDTERPVLPPSDNTMACNTRTKGMSMRHHLLLGAWRHIAHGAGVAIVVKAVTEQLWAGTGSTSLE